MRSPKYSQEYFGLPHSWNFGRRIRENCFCAVAQFAEVFHYLFLSVLTWSGHPNMENGRSPEENQVSRTSSSDEGNYQDTTLNRTVEYTLFQDNLLFGNFEFLRSSFQCDLLGRRTAGCKNTEVKGQSTEFNLTSPHPILALFRLKK